MKTHLAMRSGGLSFQGGYGRVRCKHGWVMVTAPPHPPAALQAAQAPTADALGRAGQLGIRNSMHVLSEAAPLPSAFQLRLPESRTAQCSRAG